MGRSRWIARRAALGAAGAGAAAAGVLGLELVASGLCYGAEYPWRLLTWRRFPDDWRYPARGLKAAPRPVSLALDPNAGPAIRTAFVAAANVPDLDAFARRTATTSLIVLRDGRIGLEAYYNGSTRQAPQASFSVAKAVTSALVGAAIADGLLPGVDTQAAAVLPDARHLGGSGVRIADLLRMSSGFAWREPPLPGPFGAPWSDEKLVLLAPDLRKVALSVRPEAPPGTKFFYDNRNTMLLGLMLERRTGLSVSRLLETRLWHPMGAGYPAAWDLDSRRSGFERMASGLHAAPLDFAKFGLLYLRGGLNERGERVLPAEWIAESLAPGPPLSNWDAGPDQAYGNCWWLFPRKDGPADAFAHGRLGQIVYVSRARNLVIVRTGADDAGVDWPRLVHRWAERIVPS